MRHLKQKALAKKLKAKNHLKKKNKEYLYDSDSDSDASISSVDSNIEEKTAFVGKVLNNKYIPLKFLGKGTFSQVWLVYDLANDRYLAMKCVKPKYFRDSKDEIKIMHDITKSDYDNKENIMHMYDFFIHKESEQRIMCMLFEVLGNDLMQLMKKFNYNGLPLPIVKKIAFDLLKALDYIHIRKKIIHTDLKPENILITSLNRNLRNIIECFKKINPNQILKDCIVESTPTDYNEYNKNKKKRIRKKIKEKSIEQFSKIMYDKVLIILKEEKKNNEKRNLEFKMKQKNDERQKELLQFNNHNIEEKLVNININDIEQYIENKSNNSDNDSDNDSDNVSNNNSDNSDTSFDNNLENEINNYNDSSDSDSDYDDIHNNNEIDYEFNYDFDIDINNISIKISDFGNACWTDHHLSDGIQTRQYRCPENIIGIEYDTPSDIWSVACIIFELITGDYLFNPKKKYKGNKRELLRDREHIALMFETLGKMPRELSLHDDCYNSEDLFDNKGRIRGEHKKLEYWKLKNIFIEKYEIDDNCAQELTDFLLPMLEYDPKKRATAAEMLTHKWFDDLKSN
jgi:serine/threonine protein kinase